MTQQDNGGAAFPYLHEIGDIAYSEGGMTLEDWFAGQLASGLYAGLGATLKIDDASLERDALIIYKIARSLVKARSVTVAD